MGLALRALGHGQKVVCVQFLKDDTSGEITALKTFPDFTYIHQQPVKKFVFQMTQEEKETLKETYKNVFHSLLNHAKTCDVMLLDELCATLQLALIDEKETLQFLKEMAKTAELVITGRDPLPSLLEMGDYVSCINAEKHPYDKNCHARKGIEF